ncbi:MAG: putative DNA binding domain-containing protein [Muribaculaceae bacterium]|nr:putative DNA binding domain-containing protein [Roseburia sp.]MCM1431577.1 putative DNA binding domain-containing protein [Muribaculaceae bacterium]MCM1492042.1 putative DNA binding domain-containing protein [Muribaculaceae bacterium]
MNPKEIIGEATDYDKKVALEVKKPKSWCKSVSAFANGAGGMLIFGISNDNEIIGLSDAEKDAEIISEQIKTRLDPIPEFHLSFFRTEDNKTLILLSIRQGEETPYYYSADGVMEAYVRLGNESVKADATELKRLVLRGKNFSYDALSTIYRVSDYAFSKLRERYKSWTGESLDDKKLISFGLVDDKGKLTNAGALMADNSPIRWSRVFCTRWNGLDKGGGVVDAIDDAEYSGSLISLLNEGTAFIKRNMKTMWKKTADSRIDMPEYCERSYFEALVNALVHRDYLVNGSEVHIDMFDDRMVIYSPGGMMDGTLVQDRIIDAIPSTRRNPILADVFQRLGYMERKGSGLTKIINAYKNANNYDESKMPQFISSRVEFTVILKNLNYGNDMKSGYEGDETAQRVEEFVQHTEEVFLNALRKNPKISRKELSKMLMISEDGVKYHLKKLKNKGLIEHIGTPRGGYWRVK